MFVQSGRNKGAHGVVSHVDGKKVDVKIGDEGIVSLKEDQVVAL